MKTLSKLAVGVFSNVLRVVWPGFCCLETNTSESLT
jgi:hypothetical protein